LEGGDKPQWCTVTESLREYGVAKGNQPGLNRIRLDPEVRVYNRPVTGKIPYFWARHINQAKQVGIYIYIYIYISFAFNSTHSFSYELMWSISKLIRGANSINLVYGQSLAIRFSNREK
jgi:hypothetical protein